MKNLFLISLLSLFMMSFCQMEEEQESRNSSSRFFFRPQNFVLPQNSGGCVLATLARIQSQITFYDFILKFSYSHRVYGKCPTQQELAHFNSDDGAEVARIFGGTEARHGQFPWMVYMYELQTCGSVCGGTLLNSKWVLTAAHCIATNLASLYGLVLGELQISRLNFVEQHRLIRKILVHPQYDPLTFNNDVALMQLKKPVTFTRFVRPACLPASGTGTDRIEEPTLIGDSSCQAMGWGITEVGGQPSDTLMSVPLNIRPDFLCQKLTLKSASSTRPAVFPNDPKFCAGGELNMDTCMGDSGGPIMCAINGTYNIVGVTSYGPDPCGQVGEVGVYAKTAHPSINDWIRSNIKQW